MHTHRWSYIALGLYIYIQVSNSLQVCHPKRKCLPFHFLALVHGTPHRDYTYPPQQPYTTNTTSIRANICKPVKLKFKVNRILLAKTSRKLYTKVGRKRRFIYLHYCSRKCTLTLKKKERYYLFVSQLSKPSVNTKAIRFTYDPSFNIDQTYCGSNRVQGHRASARSQKIKLKKFKYLKKKVKNKRKGKRLVLARSPLLVDRTSPSLVNKFLEKCEPNF